MGLNLKFVGNVSRLSFEFNSKSFYHNDNESYKSIIIYKIYNLETRVTLTDCRDNCDRV